MNLDPLTLFIGLLLIVVVILAIAAWKMTVFSWKLGSKTHRTLSKWVETE